MNINRESTDLPVEGGCCQGRVYGACSGWSFGIIRAKGRNRGTGVMGVTVLKVSVRSFPLGS